MTYDQIREYLAQGGTDIRYVLDAIEAHCPDEETRLIVAQLAYNIEAEAE